MAAIAVRLAYQLMGEWLQGVVYRTDLTAATFASVTAVGALPFLSAVECKRRGSDR